MTTLDTELPTAAQRPELYELTREQIAPLESLMAGWPETWCDFGRSFYCSLLGLQPRRPLAELAASAVEIVRGMAQDLGGTQPYIPVGSAFAYSAKVLRLVRAEAEGASHRELAARESLTEARVRQILAAYRREEFARRQGSLPL